MRFELLSKTTSSVGEHSFQSDLRPRALKGLWETEGVVLVTTCDSDRYSF